MILTRNFSRKNHRTQSIALDTLEIAIYLVLSKFQEYFSFKTKINKE